MGIDVEKPFEKIGKKIRKRRKLLGFSTQESLAKAVGTDRTRVSRWESGEESPKVYRERLIEVLDVDASFFTEIEDQNPSSSHRLTAPYDEIDRAHQALHQAGKENANLKMEIERLNGEIHKLKAEIADLRSGKRKWSIEEEKKLEKLVGLYTWVGVDYLNEATSIWDAEMRLQVGDTRFKHPLVPTPEHLRESVHEKHPIHKRKSKI
jgi:transcriptional regulator with XRE-family HTH domain